MQSRNKRSILKLALPSKRRMYEESMRLMSDSGMAVERMHDRQYTATIPSVTEVEVIFQPHGVIPQIVQEGTADLGIVGLDQYLESKKEDSNGTSIIIKDLKRARCRLALGVPLAWIDVDSIYDIWEISINFRQRGRILRIATEWPRLTQPYLQTRGVRYFSIVQLPGGVELAPVAGYADLVATIRERGTTLQANGLKPVQGGTILKSQACLIANGRTFSKHPQKLNLVNKILSKLEAQLGEKTYGYEKLMKSLGTS